MTAHLVQFILIFIIYYEPIELMFLNLIHHLLIYNLNQIFMSNLHSLLVNNCLNSGVDNKSDNRLIFLFIQIR